MRSTTSLWKNASKINGKNYLSENGKKETKFLNNVADTNKSLLPSLNNDELSLNISGTLLYLKHCVELRFKQLLALYKET